MMSEERGISSPIPTGSGAYVLHKILEANLPNYRVRGYDPRFTLFPPCLPFIGRTTKAALVHTTPDYAVFFVKRSTPLVVTVHHLVLDQFMQSFSSPAQRLHYRTDLRWFTKASIHMADCVTSVSRFTANMVRQELEYRRQIRIIYNGIDTKNFKPAQLENQRGIRVLFTGNPTRRKGFQWLPAIARRLRRGIVIDYTTGLRAIPARTSETNLNGLGHIPSEEMPALYQAHDILLSPTVREGFGLSIAEAMACGLPVVASDCSSIPELIDHGKGGFLCPIGDVGAFAEKINLLADSPKLRQEMGKYNRAKVEKHFTVERMVREYKELFEEVLDTRKHHR